MTNLLIILVPLTSAALYAFSSLFLKQGLQLGAGAIRSVFFNNVIMTLCFLPVLAFNHEPVHWEAVGWPILTGICFFGGQAFTVWAIKTGDVSVHTPMMGLKVIFVAVFSMILSPDPIPPVLFVSAGITALAVFLLGQSDRLNYRAVRKAILLTSVACMFFGATDSLVGARAEAFGRIPMLIGMMLTLTVCSLCLIPFVQKPFWSFPKGACWPMVLGSVLVGFQALILNAGLSFLGQATAMNVVYSIRGLFGILLVWFIGAKFGNREREEVGGRIMRSRFAGALLLMVAIGLVFLR